MVPNSSALYFNTDIEGDYLANWQFLASLSTTKYFFEFFYTHFLQYFFFSKITIGQLKEKETFSVILIVALHVFFRLLYYLKKKIPINNIGRLLEKP